MQSHLLWQRMLCLAFKMHRAAGCAKHTYIKLFSPSLFEYIKKDEEGQMEAVCRGLECKVSGCVRFAQEAMQPLSNTVVLDFG